MTNKSELFASFQQIQQRPEFSPKVEITIENFRSLVGRYHLGERVICQVRADHGICHQKHQRGYVGITKNGEEGLIGGHCGEKYFKEHTQFIQEKKRIDAEIEYRENLDKLIFYRENFLSISEKQEQLKCNLSQLHNQTKSLYNGLPDIVLRFLMDAQKTSNWNILVDVLRPSNETETRSEKWFIEKLCALRPIYPIQNLESIVGRMDNLRLVFNEACGVEISTLGTPKLKYYIKNISVFEEVETIYQKLHTEYNLFIQPDNLDVLLYVCNKDKDKQIINKNHS